MTLRWFAIKLISRFTYRRVATSTGLRRIDRLRPFVFFLYGWFRSGGSGGPGFLRGSFFGGCNFSFRGFYLRVFFGVS